jgi:cytidylate kinase
MEEKRTVQIAIDGPSGSGKSTLAKSLAAKLGFVYVDTGALYRAVGLAIRRREVDPFDADAVAACLPDIAVTLGYAGGTQQVYLNGEDVSGAIRTPEIAKYASAVSAIPAVRAFLLDTQISIAANHSVVMDGRDIGTVILPNAQVKIFLEANDEERAQRRFAELAAKGDTTSYEAVLAGMRGRDKQDSTRAVAPAIPAPDAIHIDNTAMTPEETLAKISPLIEAALA